MPEVALSGLLLDAPNSGSAEYARRLAPELAGLDPNFHVTLFVRRPKESVPSVQEAVLDTPLAVLNRGAGVGARLDKLAWETVALPLAARGYDIVHSLYFAAPIVAASRIVVTVHDVIPLVLPGYYRSRQAVLYSRLMAWATRRADAIITVSEHSKSDIVHHLQVPADRVHVTYEAAAPEFSPQPDADDTEVLRELYGIRQPYLLYVGSAERRKNLETLVRVFAAVRSSARTYGVQLVLATSFPPADSLYPDLPGLIRSLGIGEDVVVISNLGHEDRPALYRSALAFCFPSEYEGFGLPPLEALACGTPVLAADATSVPEVVSDAGLLLPPKDIHAWSEALLEVMSGRLDVQAMRERGPRRAAHFSWKRTAEETAAVYRDVLR